MTDLNTIRALFRQASLSDYAAIAMPFLATFIVALLLGN